MQATKQQIRSWINRQRTLTSPSATYLEWLRKQYKITCSAEVIGPKTSQYLQSCINTAITEES